MFSQWRNVRRVSESGGKPPDTFVVEKAKSVLPVKADQKYNVDFLTEATKLLSTAWHKGEDMSAVKMKLNRQEKVKCVAGSSSLANPFLSGRRMRLAGSTETGTPRRKRFLKTPSNNMVLSCVSSAKKLALDPFTKLSDTMAIGRGARAATIAIKPLSNCHTTSSKLKEVNIQIRKERASNRKAKTPSPPVIDDDPEGSIVKQPRSNVVCASCKTRESVQWWKAPKGLSSSVLCEDCGTSWRKYADFTKPVIREESLPASAKGKAPEKREGTPLNGPSSKRSKVWATSIHSLPNTPDD